MITLQNNRLEIQIPEPGSVYKRSRFDWSGICQQITLDGAHTFCSQEASEDDPGTEGVGLSDEFGINTPLGHDEADIGDWFPKIGVGFLLKTDTDDYNFMKDYPIEPVKFQVEQKSDNEVSFLQSSPNRSGWGWKLQKTLSLTGPTLTIAYSLENKGEKTIQTETYNHNFLVINANAIGPDYQLRVPFALKLDPILGPITTNENTLELTEIPQKYIYALQENCTSEQDIEWELIHQPSGLGMWVKEYFSLARFALWGMCHVISPEFFLWIKLQSGHTQTWKREYTFF